MDSFREIIDAFGTANLAGILGVGESHVRTMKARDSIPPEFWSIIVEKWPVAHPLTLTLEKLSTLRKKRFERPSSEFVAPSEGSAA